MVRAALAAIALLQLCGIAALAQDAKSPQTVSDSPAEVLPWHPTLEAALAEAGDRKTPTLVRVGAAWCGWCRKLDAEIEKREAQDELARWSLAHLDADEEPDTVRRLRVGPIPALRILDSSGRIVASHDGYLPAAQLVEWLQKNHDKTSAEEGQPLARVNLDVPGELGRLLKHRNPATREAAIRLAAPQRERLAMDVVGSFHRGNLTARLAAMELLVEWKAPVAELDPWKPPTITAQRLGQLEDWAEQQVAEESFTSASATLTDEKRKQFINDLEHLSSGEVSDAESVLSQWLPFGGELIGVIDEHRAQSSDKSEWQWLDWIQLRLLAADPIAFTWPSELPRISASAPLTRGSATDMLEGMFNSAKDSPENLRKLYWSIRSVPGSEAAEFRKRIREKAGAELLFKVE